MQKVNQTGIVHVLSILILVVLAAVVAIAVRNLPKNKDYQSRAQVSRTPTPCQTGTWPTDTPVGALPGQPAPIWCYPNLNTIANTHVQTANGWLDDFNHGGAFGLLETGSGYKVFNSLSTLTGVESSINKAKHWRHANHWMVDVNRQNQQGSLNGRGGALMRPDRSFLFEDYGDGKGRKLIIETDVAAGINDYQTAGSNGDKYWPEIDISNAPEPTRKVTDFSYGYGQFGGAWGIGCRLHGGRDVICAMYDNAWDNATNQNPGLQNQDCFGNNGPGRVWEISWFQQCGLVHMGGLDGHDGAPQGVWRLCNMRTASPDPDTLCRDRFRMEIWKTGLILYVNGFKFFEDSGWPPEKQLPDSLINGPVYVYFSDLAVDSDPGENTVRFHWDRVAVNPRNAQGNPLPLSAAEGFCLGQPNNTCVGASPSPTIAPTAIPSPSPAKTPTPTPTATISPTATPCRKIGDFNGDCAVTVTDLSIFLNDFNTGNLRSDLNKSGSVTVTDLSVFLSNFGK